MSTGSLARVPHSGTANCTSDNPSASVRAKCPTSISMMAIATASPLRLRALSALPMALLLQRVGDFARHVALVVAGQHGVGLEHARRIEHALGHHALTLAEQIGQNAAIRDRQ